MYLLISCTVVDCGTLQNPANGNVDIAGGTEFQNAAIYTCNLGYKLNGAESRTCQFNGSWSNTEPSCLGADMFISFLVILFQIIYINIYI